MTGRNNYIYYKSCYANPEAPVWTGCDWKTGDGIGGTEKRVGTVSGPEECLKKCKAYTHNGKKPNGASVYTKTGTVCYCEFGMNKWSGTSYTTCLIPSTSGMYYNVL